MLGCRGGEGSPQSTYREGVGGPVPCCVSRTPSGPLTSISPCRHRVVCLASLTHWAALVLFSRASGPRAPTCSFVWCRAQSVICRSFKPNIQADGVSTCSEASFICALTVRLGLSVSGGRPGREELRACPVHTPRGPAGLSPPATSVRLTGLSPLLTRGPSPTPLVPKLTLVAAESGGAGLAGQGVQGPAVVGARFTEAAASLLGDSEATSIQGLGAPRACTWMDAARGAVIGKHAAAQRHRAQTPCSC